MASKTFGVFSLSHCPTLVSFSLFLGLSSMFTANEQIHTWDQVDIVKIERPPNDRQKTGNDRQNDRQRLDNMWIVSNERGHRRWV